MFKCSVVERDLWQIYKLQFGKCQGNMDVLTKACLTITNVSFKSILYKVCKNTFLFQNVFLYVLVYAMNKQNVSTNLRGLIHIIQSVGGFGKRSNVSVVQKCLMFVLNVPYSHNWTTLQKRLQCQNPTC